MTTKRIIGLVLLVAAALFGLADLWFTYVPTYGQDDITMGRLWLLVSARSLGVTQYLIDHYLWGGIWEFGVAPILVAPAWSFFAVMGGLFIAFGRPKAVER
jgi:hypothetical protein